MPRKMKVVAIPQIKAYARITSGIEYVCPDCGKVNNYKAIRHRKPKIRCRNCEHAFMIGVMVGEVGQIGTPPASAITTERQVRLPTLNSDVRVEGVPTIARIRGGLFWMCECGMWAYDHPEWETGTVECKECQRMKQVAVIMHRSPYVEENTSPVDWVPPRGLYVPTLAKSIDATKISEGGGEDRGIVGNVGEVEEAGAAFAGGVR